MIEAGQPHMLFDVHATDIATIAERSVASPWGTNGTNFTKGGESQASSALPTGKQQPFYHRQRAR